MSDLNNLEASIVQLNTTVVNNQRRILNLETKLLSNSTSDGTTVISGNETTTSAPPTQSVNSGVREAFNKKKHFLIDIRQ